MDRMTIHRPCRVFRQVASSTIGTLALAGGIAAALPALHAAPCGPGAHLADTDQDGLYDHACVGDWNENGSCEMAEDLQTAIRELDDPGQKVVELDACAFSPPVRTTNPYAIVELPSNTELFGQGTATLLNGFPGTDVTSTRAVISNADHVSGNTNIVIRDIAIDGGWRGGDATGFRHQRMGVFFSRCDRCRAEHLLVTDTLHSCLYASNSDGIDFLDSTVKRCGNETGLGDTFPCVYLYATSGYALSNVRVAGIDCDGTGSSALNTRRDSVNARLENLLFENNIARNTRNDPVGLPKRCITVSGVGSARYLNNTCVNTGGFASIYSNSFYSENGEQSASANVLVDGLALYGSVSQRAPVTIEKGAEFFTLRHIAVHGASGNCMEIRYPVRNIVLEHSALEDCGDYGLATLGSPASAHDIAVSANSVDGAGADGLAVRLDVAALSSNIVIAGNHIRDFGRHAGSQEYHGIALSGNVTASAVAGNVVEDLNRQATQGIYENTPDSTPSGLCTNVCEGTLAPESCLYVEGDPSYGSDVDSDGVVDPCDIDDDNDDVRDDDDNCVAVFNPLQSDVDKDQAGDSCDNCMLDFNPAQSDFDEDGEGDRCDPDDGVIRVFAGSAEDTEWTEDGFHKWNIYKGDLDVLVGQGLYTQAPGSNPLAARACRTRYPRFQDSGVPPAGKTAYYLVTGVTRGSESSLGTDSSGVERVNDSPCD